MPLAAIVNEANHLAQQDDNPVAELHVRMSKMPCQMMQFSRGLRLLFAEYAVSGADKATSFIRIRDAVRQDAEIYSTTVLPLANTVVNNISAYFDNYISLEFEDWAESLEDIIEEVEEYELACEALQHLHKGLMITLKQRQDQAQVSILEMQKLSSELKKKVSSLERSARDNQDKADTWNMWGAILAVPTFGIFTAIAADQASDCRNEARWDLANAVSNKANAEIQTKAALLTQQVLIPSVAAFLEGLSVCQAFFAVTKAELVKMRDQGNKALSKKDNAKKMERHYKIMKTNGRRVDSDCKAFISCIGEVETDLEAIPRTNTDKNYVDKWLEQQMLEYEKSQRGEKQEKARSVTKILRAAIAHKTAKTKALK